MATQAKSNTKHQKVNSRNPNSAPKPKTLTSSERLDTVAPPFASPPSSSDDSSRSRTPPQRNRPATSTAGYVKLDDKVRINLDSVRSDSEVRELKRKLTSELEQVRRLRKRLEAGGVECVYGFNGNNDGGGEDNFGNGENFVGGSGRVGTLARVNSEVSYVGPANARTVKSGEEIRDKNHDQGGGGRVGVVVDKEKSNLKGNQFRKDLGLVSGKEKTLNLEGEKKLKSSGGGRKVQGGDVPGFGSGMDKYPKGLFKKCCDLLAKLMKHKYGWVFNAPVDVKKLKLHDYYNVIKHPMDLGTVKTRLSKNWYKSPMQFAEDVRLTFNNAMAYNEKGQDVHIMADALLKIFEEQWDAVVQEYKVDERFDTELDASRPTPPSKKVPAAPSTHAHTPVQRLPLEKDILDRSKTKDIASIQGKKQMLKKPKSKDPTQKCMTYEEKQKLSTNLQNLPSDRLEGVVQIIRKRNPNLFQQGDEIEVDIDSFDIETLWELDSFVANFMKSLTKSVKKADITGEEVTEAIEHNMQESYATSNAAKAPKGPEKVGRNAHKTSLAQGEKKGYGASGSNGSNSSSSDSSSRDSKSEGSLAGSDDRQ